MLDINLTLALRELADKGRHNLSMASDKIKSWLFVDIDDIVELHGDLEFHVCGSYYLLENDSGWLDSGTLPCYDQISYVLSAMKSMYSDDRLLKQNND